MSTLGWFMSKMPSPRSQLFQQLFRVGAVAAVWPNRFTLQQISLDFAILIGNAYSQHFLPTSSFCICAELTLRTEKESQ